jgi:hypothetical protein
MTIQVVSDQATREARAREIHVQKLFSDVQGLVGRSKVTCDIDPFDGMYTAVARGMLAKSSTRVGALRKLWNKIRSESGPVHYHSVTNHTHPVMDRHPFCPMCKR